LAVNLSIPYDELEKLIEDLENDVIRVTKRIIRDASQGDPYALADYDKNYRKTRDVEVLHKGIAGMVNSTELIYYYLRTESATKETLRSHGLA
jgi:hypothetical protein